MYGGKKTYKFNPILEFYKTQYYHFHNSFPMWQTTGL